MLVAPASISRSMAPRKSGCMNSRYANSTDVPGRRILTLKRKRSNGSVLEAGVNQCGAWGEDGHTQREHILVGVTRNLAAHCPTRRAGQQTALIAARLHRGEKMFEG